MDINEEITKMNLYKTFEPYIDKSVTMEERLKARVRLVDTAPQEAKDALAKWTAMKLKSRLVWKLNIRKQKTQTVYL